MHNFVRNSVFKKGVQGSNEYICSICNIKAFMDNEYSKYYIYTVRNGFKPEYNNSIIADNITCEEFIIKNIIE